jgi:hypothetical protein
LQRQAMGLSLVLGNVDVSEPRSFRDNIWERT